MGAADSSPTEQGAGETPLIGGEHLSSSSQILENLEGLTEKVSTLGLQVTRKNRCGAAKKQARKARLTEAPTGDSGSGQPWSAQGGKPQISQKPSTSGTHHGQGLSLVGLNPWKVRGAHRAHVSDSCRPGALPRVGRPRGPNRLGNLVKPGPLGRAFGWQLYARITQGVKSPRKTL